MNYFNNFKLKNIEAAHHNTTYRGVTYRKNPFDYVLYQMLISEIRPDIVLEIGTNLGGGALYISDILSINNLESEVHTIDIIDMVESDLVKNNKKIKRFLGGYESYDLDILKKYKNVLIIDDGSHTYTDVSNCLNKFNTFISVGSYFIIEDGIIDELNMKNEYNGGPVSAIEDFLKTNDNFVIDQKWCNFYGENITFNTNGFLRRVK